MFTIIVDSMGQHDGVIGRDRLLEGTESRLKSRLNSMNEEDLERYLSACPVLWSPEHVDGQVDGQVEPAYVEVGRFEQLRIADREVKYKFRPYPGLSKIPALRIYELNPLFNLEKWGWHRTKITVFDDDLIEILANDLVPTQVSDVVEKSPEIPNHFKIESKKYKHLVSVMMPFMLPKLEPVWAKLDRELARLGIECHRADTETRSRRIIDKVANLIYHADTVICDFTGANVNVYYEAGLAHAWTKNTIFIAEVGTPLSFDTADEAVIFYENTDLGLKNLWYEILDRLREFIPEAFTNN